MFQVRNALLLTVLAVLIIILEMFIIVSADTWLSNEKKSDYRVFRKCRPKYAKKPNFKPSYLPK